MIDTLRRLRGPLIAVVALALSASLTFGAQAPAAGYALGGSYEDGNGTPEASGDEDTNETQDTNESTDETTSDSADNCTTDPTGLTEEELAAMTHGSIVCWAAHQTEWPAWFKNHGQFVSCWAHQGKAGAPSCTVAPSVDAATKSHGQSKGKGKPAN